ncbi:TPA: hemagglutinin repeat-containing protein [Acinetobacter baumannii]
MNKNCYRVIFSQARGMFIAVAEIVKSRTKTAGQSNAPGTDIVTNSFPLNSYKKLNPLNFAVVTVLGAVVYTIPLSSIANTQIHADKSAPNNQQPQILNSANGTVQVNIQTPSAGGVSRNTYTQFDVGQQGAILNNSRNNVQTQIGGWVQGNANLARGEAKVILNEVNSSNPSQLRGYLEVAGKSAQVVIANPSGLVCDGCGVINADRFTLTTGQAVMNQGYLESFRVREGQVTIEGKGLNGSLTPYTDIYARALKVNAGLYANELNTVLGQNDIQVKDQTQAVVTAISTSNNTSTHNTVPSSNFALDVGQLGGMYAGKIYLVGTEQGLGVRNAGSMNATTGQLSLNANGDLINTGNMIANKDQISIQAQNIKNSGNISSTQHNIQIKANNIQNSGLIATNDEIQLNTQDKIDNNNGVINAGRIDFTAQTLSNDNGKIEQTGQQQLNISAKTLDNTQGLIGRVAKDSAGSGQPSDDTTPPSVTDPEQQSSAQDSSTVEVAPVDLTPKTFQAGNIQIAQGIDNVAGQIVNNADINLKVQDSIKNNAGEIQLPELQFSGQNFENQQGKFTAKVVNINAQNIDNQNGVISASQSFDLTAQQLNNNQGRLQSTKALNITSTEIDNRQGQILAADALALNSANTNNTQGVIASVNADARLNINSLDNSKGEISAQNVHLTGQRLNNQQGTIQAKTADLNINVDQIDNGSMKDLAGHLIAEQNLKLNAQQLQSTGQIYAGNTADLSAEQLKQHGQLAAQNKINVQSNSIESNQNAVWAAGLDKDGKLSNADATLTIDAQNAQIAGRILSGDQINIKAAQTADLSQSESQAKNVKIETTQLDTNNAKIIADRQLDIRALQSINNEKGQYSTEQVNLNTAQLNNNQGLIQHTGQNDFILNVADRIDNNAGQIISNANTTEIKTNTLSSVAGEILHAGDQQLKITAQNLQGQQGKIQSNSDLQLNLGTSNLDKALTAAQSINLSATELSHQQGQLIQSDANGHLQVNVAQTLNNMSGVISAAGHANVKTADLNNESGVIQTLANKDLSIESQKLENQSGKIVAGRDSAIKTTQLNNDTGTVYAAGKLGLHATQDVSNQQGLIAAKQSLSIEAQNLNNSKGQIQTESGDVNLTIAQTLNNQAGHIQATNALNIVSAQVENQAGQLLSGTDTQLDVTQLNNQSGTIYSKKQLDLNILGTTDNSAGTLAADQNLNLNTQNLLNQAGQIRSENADLNLNITQNIQNNSGLISAAKNLNLTAQNVTSQKAKIQSGANANIQLNNLDNTEGVVYAAEQLQLLATGELNNKQGIVAAEQLTDIKAGSVINDAGQIRSQQDQLKLNVQQEISNQNGEISAAKAIELNAQKLSNQKGKVIAGALLNAAAQQVDNTEGTVYAKDQLHLTVTDHLNNQSGRIAANQLVQIQAKNLNNTAGKIRSEQNQLDLNVEQNLDNQTGEIFTGTQAKINATTVNNQQGVVYGKDQIDLTTGQLNNQQGQIYSEGQAELKVQGDLQNQQGILAAGQNLNINSAGLDNTAGTIRSENADITLNAQGQLINAQGDIYAGHNASLNSVGLDNSSGQIAAQNQLTIDTQKQQLSNQNGKIIAKAVDLKIGKLDNHAGLIQSEQSVKIDTQQNALINNNSGSNAGILSQGSLDIANVSELENSNGYIAVIGSANITAQNINNNSGQINSQADLTIQQQLAGGRIDNVAGQIQAQQNLNLNTDTIYNSGVGSHLVAGEKLTANTTQLINSQTKDATTLGGIDAKNIEINAAELDNQSGVIRASENATLNINNQLSNQLGSISSLNTLSIGTTDKTLNLNNTDGELLAKNQLSLKANELVNKGKIISEGNVDIDLKQSYTHTQADQIAANGTLKLSTEQDLINQSELSAGQKVELNAKNIQNQTGASISSNETHLIAQDTIHNQGLINGELTHIQANRVWNDGARIYGSHVAIQANTLDNKSNAIGTGAVIASRGDMDLGIQILNNQSGGVVKENGRDNAWIFSAGQLNVGGSLNEELQVQGNADRIYNGSAVIESLGDMYLGANNIQNLNENLVISLVEKYRKQVQEYGKDGEVWDSSVIRLGSSSRGLSNAILYVPQEEGGAPTREIGEDWSYYEYTQIHSEDEVRSTSPAQIIAGGNLSFMPDADFLNKDSQVLVGLQITNGIGSIRNESTQLKSVDQTAPGGFSQWHSVGWNTKGTEHRHRWGSKVNYQPADIIKTMPISLGIVKEYTAQQSVNPAENLNSSNVQTEIAQAQSVDLTALHTQKLNNQQLDLNAGQSIAEIGKNIQQPDLPDQIGVEANPTTDIQAEQNNIDRVEGEELNQVNNTALAVDSASEITVRTVSQDFLNLPSNALFITTKDSQAQYLVETDPAYANYKKWLSSDYMLDALGLDPALQQKRIGDGYYEQRLVQDQVAKLTGYRFLEGYGSDEEQYKALMNNGLSFAKQYQLRPGIALTEAQIAQLTSDIVWLEEKTVKLADGTTTKALVPQVYVKSRVGDLKGDGTLISADSIKLDVQGDVFNSGTIAGRQAVILNAENVELLSGRIQANQVGLNTRKDLNIVGGQIQAGQAVDLNVGRNFNLESSTQSSQNSVGESVFSYTGLDRLAGIYSNAPLKQADGKNLATSISIKVGGDTTLKAAEIQNSNGSTQILTQGNLNVGAIQTGVSNKGYANEKNYNYSTTQVDQGSSIQSQGTVDLSANKIQGKAVDIASQQGDIVLNAQQGIRLENGKNLHNTDSAMSAQSGGLFGRNMERNEVWKSDQSIANGLKAGGNIVMNTSQGDITATHLKANAGETIQVQAKNGHVTLNSALNENSQSTTSSSTNFATYNNRQSGYIDQEVAQTTLKAGNTVDINAGKNIELQANDVQAGQSIYVGNTLMQRQADGTLKAADGSVMPENVTLSTLETHDQQWDEQQKGYRGIAKELVKSLAIGMPGLEAAAPGLNLQKKLTVGESNSQRTEQIRQIGTNLNAKNIAVGSSGQTTLTSADLTAKNVALSGQKVTLNAAEEQNIESRSHSTETIEGLGAKLNKDSIRLGGFVSEKDKNTVTVTETTHKAGSINTENLSINAAEGVDILGQNIKATGDTTFDHGRGTLKVGGYENKTITEEKTKNETISTEVGVRNAYLDAALAVGAVKDAASALKDAKDAYSQAQRDYAAGKLTKEALDDSKSNVAMATANLASAEIGAAAAAAAAVAAASTSYGTGFTIGANGERIETTTNSNQTQGHWQGSNLELNNLTLKSEGQNANIQGSRLTATGTTTFNGTKDLNVTAGTEHGTQESSSKTNSQSVSYTYGGGGSASIGKQTSKSQSESLTHVNSEVALNRTEGQLNKLNIQGGEVSIADRGNLQVNQIHVESLQDTAKSSNSSKGGSIGGGVGSTGKASNISASYNQSKGSSDSAWVNNTSKLLVGDKDHDANLDAMGVKQVTNIGGVIANATKNADGTLTDHKGLNYSGALELKDIQDHNYNSSRGLNVSTTIGKTTQEKDGQKSKYPNGSTTLGLNSSGQETEQLTKATMGQGTVKNTTELTNRDINTTQEITRDQTTGMINGSVTVDHRLLSESGRAEIVQQQKDLPENFRQGTENLRQSAENVIKALPESEYKKQVLQTLNNVQAKLYTMPTQYKDTGALGSEVVLGLIKEGVEPQTINKLFDDKAAGMTIVLENLNDLNSKIDNLKQQGLTINDILGADKNQSSTVSDEITFKDYKVGIENKSTIGASLLQEINFIGNSIKEISKDTGVDLGTVQLAVGLMVSGPVRLVVDSAKSLGVDTLVGPYKEKGIDVLANAFTASAHLTSTDVVEKLTNPQYANEVPEVERDTYESLSNELSNSKQGAEYLINAAAGIVVGGIGGAAKTTKIDGKDVEVSTAGIGSRDELTKPYDPVQTRNDLEVVHGSENVKSTTVPPYNAKNVKLAGQRHPVTGVVFDNKGYPVFDDIARYDTNLINKGYSNLSYTKQMELASKDLWNAIQRGEVNSSQFSSSQLRQIQSGSSKIDDYTWHHHQDNGRMQLVPEWEHSKTGHIGGDAMQGGK